MRWHLTKVSIVSWNAQVYINRIQKFLYQIHCSWLTYRKGEMLSVQSFYNGHFVVDTLMKSWPVQKPVLSVCISHAQLQSRALHYCWWIKKWNVKEMTSHIQKLSFINKNHHFGFYVIHFLELCFKRKTDILFMRTHGGVNENEKHLQHCYLACSKIRFHFKIIGHVRMK